jgi:transcriptional regulator with XRE-family HTH domain
VAVRMAGKSEDDVSAMRRIRAHFRQQMAERGLSQNELGSRCGLSSGTISKIMTADRGVKVGIVLKLLRGLGISGTRLLEENPPEQFFNGDPVPPPLRPRR